MLYIIPKNFGFINQNYKNVNQELTLSDIDGEEWRWDVCSKCMNK